MALVLLQPKIKSHQDSSFPSGAVTKLIIKYFSKQRYKVVYMVETFQDWMKQDEENKIRHLKYKIQYKNESH